MSAWWRRGADRPVRAQRNVELNRRLRADREASEAHRRAVDGGRMERAGWLASVLAGKHAEWMEDTRTMTMTKKATAERLQAIAAQREADVARLIAQLQDVTGPDADRHPAEFRERRQRELRAAIGARNDAAQAEAVKVIEPLAQASRARAEEGTPLTPEEAAEVNLLVRQFEGRTAIEQRRHLAQEAARVLDLGAVGRARRLHVAAVTLGVGDDHVATRLEELDPVKRQARGDLDAMDGILSHMGLQVAREANEAGIADMHTAVVAELARTGYAG